MYVERLLQIHVAAMAAVATLLLGMGQQSMALPLMVFVAAAVSVWLTDITGTIALNRLVANLAALGAGLLTLHDLGQLPPHVRILGLANLLVYLQVILLFQKKDARRYRLLAMLSLLQVVVSAVFNQGLWFGILLTCYLFLGLSTLLLIHLYGEVERFHAVRKVAAATANGRPQRRWPLAASPVVFSGATGGRHGVGWELFGRVGGMGISTLGVAAIIFIAVPRLGDNAWRGPQLEARRVVGYTDTITLGELGQIIESPQEVLRIRFLDAENDEPYRVTLPEVYLHGTLVNDYRAGTWRYSLQGHRHRFRPLTSGPGPPEHRLVRQRITIEPLERLEVFCVWPFYPTNGQHSLRFDAQRPRLLRQMSERAQRLTFELYTTAFRNGIQTILQPADTEPDLDPLLQFPGTEGPEGLPTVARLAEEWLAESQIPPEDLLGRLRHLEFRLRDSEAFQYSLDGPPRDPSIDPLEDFLTNNPRGHCEYFSTALTMMLRSQGIPAQMVIGFRTDEWNEPGRFFQVRQLHAHTWVEAYVAPEFIPKELWTDSPLDWSRGAWMRLEATPGGLDAEAAGIGPKLAVERFLDALGRFWSNYVLEMDEARQREDVYEPAGEWMSARVSDLADPEWWQATMAQLRQALDVRRWNVNQWFSWRGGLAAMAVCLVLVIAYRTLRLVIRAALRQYRARVAAARARQAIRVAFYRRFENLVGKTGLIRGPAETQEEFAAAAGRHLAERAEKPELAAIPSVVASAFYQVRFGHTPLDKTQQTAVREALDELESALSTGKRP